MTATNEQAAAPDREQPAHQFARQPDHRPSDAPGAPPEPADTSLPPDWRERAEQAESRVAELGNRLAAVEAAADDLRRMVGQSQRARQIDRELLIAGVVDLEGARPLIEEQIESGATVLEAVSRVRERRPLLFTARRAELRATGVPAGRGMAADTAEGLAEAARETGDRRLLLRYLRMRRGEA